MDVHAKHVDYFIKILKLMELGYLDKTGVVGQWQTYRTDDVLVIDEDDEFRLVCRGTEMNFAEWFRNLTFSRREWLNMGKVHRGFALNVDEILGREDEKYSLLNQCIEKANNGQIIELIGHSRGSVIAMLLATKLVSHGISTDQIHVFGCGSPRVGDDKFMQNYNAMLGEQTLIFNAVNDPVTFAPPWNKQTETQFKIRTGFFPRHRIKHYIDFLEQRMVLKA